MSCYFIGYPDKSKGYRFYCLDRFTKFVETRQAVFLEDLGNSGSFPMREINLEEIRAELSHPDDSGTNDTSGSAAIYSFRSEYTLPENCSFVRGG